MEHMGEILKGIDLIYKELEKHYKKIKPVNTENIQSDDIFINKKEIRHNGYSGFLRIRKEGIRLEIEENYEFIEITQRYKQHKVIFDIPKKDDISILHVLYDPDIETPEFSLKYINIRKEQGETGLLVVDKKYCKTEIFKTK